jgi:hypothetical protein
LIEILKKRKEGSGVGKGGRERDVPPLFLRWQEALPPGRRRYVTGNDLGLKARKAGCPRANKHRGNMCVGGQLTGCRKRLPKMTLNGVQ